MTTLSRIGIQKWTSRQDLFDRVVKYIIENMGKTFSASSIAKFLKSEHRTVSVESIYNYLRWLEQIGRAHV